ncbi:hypothetical protein MHU86_4512 [Fragilaria crotonensis]|nr:hypothetical protein MHU86_4512 [Fragilaria crotonensis]
MTFGGAPNPSQWSNISEVITDLANHLVRRSDWDPTVWSAPQQKILRTSEAVDNDRGHVDPGDEFGKAFTMSVEDPVDDGLAKFECYLDDLFGVFLARDEEKAEAVLPLAMHLVGRPVDERAPESFPRDDLLAASKFLAEAKASERKTILGWDVNTRSFKVSPPTDKRLVWVNELQRLGSLPGRRAHAKELETTIGRLNHAAYVVPNSRPFLGRLYRASERAQACGLVKLSNSQVADLKLWETFLDAAAKGISINRLVFRWPTRIVRVDACPQGMGGYGLQSGIAWRLLLPPDWIGRGFLNCLEFLAALVGVWVEHQAGEPWVEDDVVLCQGDSSSATGWIARSSFGDECPLHLAIARTMARYMIDHELTHYSQWFLARKTRSPTCYRYGRWLAAAATAQDSAFTIETRAQRDRSWRRFQSFLGEIGNENDPFLLRLKPEERIEVFTGFAAAIREGWTGGADDRDEGRPSTQRTGHTHGSRVGRKAGTVRAAIDGVVQTYRANKLGSPAHDSRGRLDPLLAAQLRGYALDNPEPSQRQALPAAVVEMVAKVKTTETHRAIGQLVTGAFFFAMRSCEYSEASGSRRTKTVQIGDIVFRRNGKTIDGAPHESALVNADTVSVTNRTQKNGDRGVTVTQHRTKTKPEAGLCPVRALAELVSRISSYDLDETRWKDVATRPMNLVATFASGTQVTTITSGEVLRHLRAAAIQYGEGRLGFPASRIGTHSLRAGAAMAMFLAGVPAETIQLIGRWRSQTFMRYIRIQVQQMTRGVADVMTTNPEFFTIDRKDA